MSLINQDMPVDTRQKAIEFLSKCILELIEKGQNDLLKVELENVNHQILKTKIDGKSIFRTLIESGHGAKINPQLVDQEILLESDKYGVLTLHLMAQEGLLTDVDQNIIDQNMLGLKTASGKNAFHYANMQGNGEKMPTHCSSKYAEPDEYGNLHIGSHYIETSSLGEFINATDNSSKKPIDYAPKTEHQEEQSPSPEEISQEQVEKATLQELIEEYHSIEDFLAFKKKNLEDIRKVLLETRDPDQDPTLGPPTWREDAAMQKGVLLLLSKRNEIIKKALEANKLHTLEMGGNVGITQGMSTQLGVNIINFQKENSERKALSIDTKKMSINELHGLVENTQDPIEKKVLGKILETRIEKAKKNAPKQGMGYE